VKIASYISWDSLVLALSYAGAKAQASNPYETSGFRCTRGASKSLIELVVFARFGLPTFASPGPRTHSDDDDDDATHSPSWCFRHGPRPTSFQRCQPLNARQRLHEYHERGLQHTCGAARTKRRGPSRHVNKSMVKWTEIANLR